MRKVWYSLSKNENNKKWTIWLNHIYANKLIGGCGSKKVLTADTKQECLDYCKEKKIKLKRG